MIKNISIIVAVDKSFGIGIDGKLLCYLPNDLKRFKKITLNHKVIMGRKTFFSLPKRYRPLSKRINIVLTKNKEFSIPGCAMAYSLEEAISFCQKDETFVIGGSEIYQQFLPFTGRLYLTKIHHKFKADTFFPTLDFNKWKLTYEKENQKDIKHLYKYTYLKLTKK